jgi:glycerol dehydrogenase
MYKKAVFPGKYIQGTGAVSELPALVSAFGKRALLLGSPSVITKVVPSSGLDLESAGIRAEEFRGECCEAELKRIASIVKRGRIDVMIGMGGGKTIDAAKIVADRADIPVIVVPTIASTDAPCSGCAVVYTDKGEFDYVYYQKANPEAVVVDLGIIADAPTRFLVAGMGDALSTWFEARSCARTHSENACGGYATLSSLRIAELCYETLLEYGSAAKIANENRVVTPAFDRIVEANILLSGLGFESGGLATAHSVHNGLTALAETHRFYHGEKVAFGVLVGLHLNDASREEMETVYSFCEEVGLPTNLADLGLADAGRSQLAQVAERSCAPDQPIHHEAGTITKERVLDAIIAADAQGRQRKQRIRPKP